MIKVNDLKNGVVIEYDGKLMQIIEFMHVLQNKVAYVRVKMKDLQNIVLQMENEIEETVGTIDGNYFMYLVDVVEERMKALLFFLAIFSVPWGRKIYIFRFLRKGICFGVLFGVFVRLYSLWGIGIFMMFTFPHELLYLLSEINGIKLLEGLDRKYQNRLWYFCDTFRVVGGFES